MDAAIRGCAGTGEWRKTWWPSSLICAHADEMGEEGGFWLCFCGDGEELVLCSAPVDCSSSELDCPMHMDMVTRWEPIYRGTVHSYAFCWELRWM